MVMRADVLAAALDALPDDRPRLLMSPRGAPLKQAQVREWEGRPIPEALLSGDHARIARWRREQSERLTRERRPDLAR